MKLIADGMRLVNVGHPWRGLHAPGGALPGSCPSATAAQPPWLPGGQTLPQREAAHAEGPGNLLKGRVPPDGVRGLQESHVLRNNAGRDPACLMTAG